LFLPGLLNTARIWRGQVENLGDLADAKVADLTAQDSISGLAQGILDMAPERFALAGLSMGGYVAFEIMRTAPDRGERLALVDTTARPDGPENAAKRTVLVAEARSRGLGLGPVIPQLLLNFLSPVGAKNPAMVRAVTEMANEIGVEAFERQQTAIMGRPDSRPDLAGIKCPTVVIVGREDATTGGEIAREMADGIPGAHLAEIPAAGHLSPLENPEAVTAALERWLVP